jgi:hypothetical protein
MICPVMLVSIFSLHEPLITTSAQYACFGLMSVISQVDELYNQVEVSENL